MAVKYLAGERLTGTAAERAAMTTSASAIPQTSWKEIARVTLSSAGNTIDTGTGVSGDCTLNTMYATQKENMMVLLYLHGNTAPYCNMTFNNSSGGTDYKVRVSHNGGTDSVPTTYDKIEFGVGGTVELDNLTVLNIVNKSTHTKFLTGHTVEQNTINVGNPPERQEIFASWVGSAQINRITLTNTRGGHNFLAGSEMVVLGCDNNEADSGTNFWEELATIDQTENSRSVDTGAFTSSKKYLMFESRYKYTSGNDPYLQFNSDHSTHYDYRRSINGGSDTNSGGSGTGGVVDNANSGWEFQDHVFVVNVLNSEKLVICDSVNNENVVGTGTAPSRREFVGKWDQDELITSIQYYLGSTGNMTGSIRVWGSN